jgi:hypothetical protein
MSKDFQFVVLAAGGFAGSLSGVLRGTIGLGDRFSFGALTCSCTGVEGFRVSVGVFDFMVGNVVFSVGDIVFEVGLFVGKHRPSCGG